MRFKKRLSAAILAIAMIVSSVQIPGETTYAAQIAGSNVESVQDASMLAAEETESVKVPGGGQNQSEEDTAADDGAGAESGSQTESDAWVGDNPAGNDVLAGDDPQTGSDNLAGNDDLTNDDTQTGDDTPAEDDNVTGDDIQIGDDTLADIENDLEEETETEQVSGNDLAKSALSEEEAESEIVEAKIEGVYQFGDVPEQETDGDIAFFSASDYAAYADGVEEYLYQQMLKREGTIDITSYKVSISAWEGLVGGVINEHPDLYFVENNFKCTSFGGYVIGINVTYGTGYDDAAFKESTARALSCVDEGMSDLQKAAALHDYLAVNSEYDYQNYLDENVPAISHTAYGTLVNGTSVCQGYALAYKYLLNQLGIECYMVSSKSANHAWNMVKLDGKYYHVDATHDDPTWDMVGRVMHTHLFCTDSELAAQCGEHGNDWQVTEGSNVVDYKATDTTYTSAFWKDSTAPLVIQGSDCYYISGSGSLKKASFSNIAGAGTDIVSSIGQWNIWGGGGFWTDTYSGLYMMNGRLYYNDATSIYSIGTDGNDKRTVFTADTSNGYIYGSACREGTVYYALHQNPQLTAKENVLIAEISEVDPPEETKDGYNVDNLDDNWLAEFAFENVFNSSGKNTPKANGKPVVLMFYNSSSTGTNGVSTFQSVAGHADYFKTGSLSSVDFYTIDTNLSASTTSIKNFAESNKVSGTGVINWLYVQKATPCKNDYLSRISEKSSVTGNTFPLMIYMDQNNKIQYATEGSLTAEEILVNLRQYCGYTQYRITYEMNGGLNHWDNPAMYTGDEEVNLKNPVYREKYLFNGWYKDPQYRQKVSKIPAGNKNDITLYAKWTQGAYDLANLTQEYTTLAGTKVSSAADGKPKLLLFFDSGSDLDTGTLETITEELTNMNHDLHGVDIYAIEITKATKSALETYSQNLSKEITFCYDTTGAYEAYRQAYMDAAGFVLNDTEGGIFKCYIDKNNRFQYVNPHICMLEYIMEDLQEYCQYPYVGYKIRYELGGGTNNSDNPSSYHSEMETITLKAPTKEGYRFAGWYSDAAFTKRVTEIPKGSTGDITLYAQWKEGLNADNLDYTFKTVDGATVSTKADGKPKMLFFYKGSETASRQEHQEISEHVKAFEGVDIYAVAVSENKSTVNTFKNQYGSDNITYCYDTLSQSGSTYQYQNGIRMARYVQIVDSSGAGASAPVIVYIDAENHVQQVAAGTRSWTGIFEDLREYCNHDGYWIDYELDGGKNSGENPYIYKSNTDTILLKDPAKGAHLFDGWYKDAAYTQKVTQIPKGSSGDITLYAKWIRVGEGLGLENLDRTFKTLDDTTFSSTAANGRPRLLIFYKYDCLNSLATLKNMDKAKGDFDGVDIYAIECQYHDKDTLIQSQKENGYENITVSYDEGTDNSSAMIEYASAVGISVNQIIFPVICYIDADNYLQWVSQGKAETAENIAANLKKYCDFPPDPEGMYKITYVLDGGTNHKDNPSTYISGTEDVILKDPSKAKFIFDGWYKDSAFTEKVTKIAKESTGNIILYAKWNEDESGRFGLENLDQTYKGLGGETLSSKADGKPKLLVFFMTDSNASKNTFTNMKGIIDSLEGVDIYAVETSQASRAAVNTFKNSYGSDGITFAYDDWSSPSNYDKAKAYEDAAGLSSMYSPIIAYVDKDNKLQWVTENEQTGDAILENLKKYCNYPPQQEEIYQITYELDGGKNDSANPTTYTAITEAITLVDPVKEGYIFEGWYKDALFTETGKVTEIPKGSTGDITLYAKWKEAVQEPGTYRITYILDGGTNNSRNPDTYTSETNTIVLRDAVKEGYLFEGWYQDEKFTQKVTRIVKGSSGDITLYAKWSPVESTDSTYKVTFDVQGHGTAPAGYEGISAGALIDSPKAPTANGYRFEGWYRDAACTTPWNFETDTVQADLTLYARWFRVSADGSMAVQEITDLYYNGKAQKPTISVYDEDTLLKAGKDYTVKYINNVNANAGGTLKGETFNEKLPYVEITGKGNYKETVRINFNILRAPLADDSGNPATGVVLKINDHLAKATRPQKPFGSLKYGKSLKAGTDYELRLRAVDARDDSGKTVTKSFDDVQVPAGYTGEFELTVIGRGNYTGRLYWTVYVADKAYLMKNAKITLGKGIKNVAYTGTKIRLTPAAEKADDVFTVQCGNKVLTPYVDYYVSYNNNTAVGKAELVITGRGEYIGKKTTNFNITGKVLTNGTITVTGLEDKIYTGKAITQDADVILTWKDGNRRLVSGRDYTISYAKNTNKGTATVTFTGTATAGYSGKISKTFKINAADISDVNKVIRDRSMNAITLPYSKAGVKPVNEIILTDVRGIPLQNGKDYTLSYKNNKAVAGVNAEKAPTVTVKGKGNYGGSFDVKFTIAKADLRGAGITIECTPVPYDSKKADDYIYKPSVKVRDGKAVLKAGTDYEITYEKNTQEDCKNYIQNLTDKQLTVPPLEGRAMAIITAKADSAYTLREPIKLPLEIYLEKLTKSNLDVQIGEAVYTGGQVRPRVTVTYKGEGGSILLEEDTDYILIYGTNVASGKNKGSVTVKGLAPDYGGSVVYKFGITQKDLKY